MSEDPDDPSTGWNKKLTFESKGGALIGKIYGKAVEGFRTDWTRVVTEWKDISFKEWCMLYKDWEGLMKGDPQYKAFKVIERNNQGEVSVAYCRVGLGMFMTDRDVLMAADTQIDDDKSYTIIKSTEHPDCPV